MPPCLSPPALGAERGSGQSPLERRSVFKSRFQAPRSTHQIPTFPSTYFLLYFSKGETHLRSCLDTAVHFKIRRKGCWLCRQTLG